MRVTARALALILVPFLLSVEAAGQGGPARGGLPGLSPLFAETDPLELTLVADFDALEGDRNDDRPSRPAALRLGTAGAAGPELSVSVRTRGNFRLRSTTCSFPNLRIDFEDGPALEASPFQGQGRLKLVSHCRSRSEFEQNTLEEYLIYRLYNLVTDASFRVRLARVTYLDVDPRREPLTRYAFFIEGAGALAARLGGVAIEAVEVDPLRLDPVPTARLELFQYMIGNTDFSLVFGHNSQLVAFPDGSYQAVPYDFDFSGLVDARYAFPDSSLGTRSVRERVFRGFCRAGLDPGPIYADFIMRRSAFRDVFLGQAELEERNARRAVSYLDEFFRTIESPGARRSQVERRCRNVPR